MNIIQSLFLRNSSIAGFNWRRMFKVLFVRYPISSPDKMRIDFDFNYASNAYKHFSFLRSKNETLSGFLERLKIKLNVELEKSLKKKKFLYTMSEDFSAILVNNTSIINENVDLTTMYNDMPLEMILIDNAILRIDNNDYRIVINPPIINFIRLPKVLLTKCVVLPLVFLEHGNMIDLCYSWYISSDNRKWNLVSSVLSFVPESSSVNNFMKLVCVCKETNQSLEVKSKNVIIECPKQEAIEARWKYTSTNITDTDKFRFMSYNLLADIYSDSSKAPVIFRHCPVDYLKMEYRQSLLIREIENYNSDIICLQEVGSNFYKNTLNPYFSINGFRGLFQVKGSSGLEGQSIFWRKSKFKFVEDVSIESLSSLVLDDNMTNLKTLRDFIHSSLDLLQKWIELKQCMVGCILQSVDDDKQQIIVSNTHLHFRPHAELIRFLQVTAIIMKIESLKQKYPHATIAFAGDFNDVRSSSAVKFVLNGSGLLSNPFSTVDSGICVKHKLSLQSAYNAIFTNYTLDFSGELDYIFYDSLGLLCTRTVPFPSLEEVTLEKALPNKDFPSDHLSLVADFQFIS